VEEKNPLSRSETTINTVVLSDLVEGGREFTFSLRYTKQNLRDNKA
jgi:hypothetical protein